MDHLYTPWRMSYLTEDKKSSPDACIFCIKAASSNETTDRAEHMVAKSKFVYATLNLYPYNNGHLMIVPYEHLPSMESLAPEALTDLMVTANKAMAAVRKIYNPQAFNVGANIGSAAGAGIAGHFHLHVVPRWSGDTNFMTVVGDTRVLPDLLDETWRKLREAWEIA